MQKYKFQCRKALPSDDIKTIAKYLYLTDPYIYPEFCADPTDPEWVKLIQACIKKENNIFSINHLSVVTCDNVIMGVMCVIPCAKKLEFISDEYDLPKSITDKIRPVIEGYFDPLISDSFSYNGFNVTNVCVDGSFRGMGAGKRLMSYCVEKYGEQEIHLDVIASNEPAINLYKRFGFEILNEYYGYSGDNTKLLCYHMMRKSNK